MSADGHRSKPPPRPRAPTNTSGDRWAMLLDPSATAPAPPRHGISVEELCALGQVLIRVLHDLLIALRAHDPKHEVVTRALKAVHESIGGGVLTAGHVELHLANDLALINGERIVLPPALAEAADALQRELAQRGLGGFTFERALTQEVLRTFFTIGFGRAAVSAEEREQIRRGLQEFAALGIRTHDVRAIRDSDVSALARSSRVNVATRAWARAAVAFGELVEGLRRSPASGPSLLDRHPVVRIVQDLVDLGEQRASFLLRTAILQQKSRPALDAIGVSYASAHAANTAVTSILIGSVLGLERVALLELGASAFLADVGFALLPDELTERDTALTDVDRARLQTAMIQALGSLLGRGRVNDSTTRRIIVAYEHHTPCFDPRTNQPSELHAFSRIVAVADAFDAMTSKRSWREPLTQARAMEILESGSGSKYDPVVVTALGSLLDTFVATQHLWR